MRNQILAAGVFFLSLLSPLKVSAEEKIEFDSIFFLGDSTTDTGRLFDLTNGAAPSDPPYFQGRFTNGPIWSDYLQPLLGAEFVRNYAIPGATTGDFNVRSPVDRLDLPGLLAQVDELITEFPTADPEALYAISVGTNDFIYQGLTDANVSVGNVMTAVEELLDYGAQNILVTSIPPLGEIPLADFLGTSDLWGSLVDQHNTSLGQAILALDQTLDPSVQVTYHDVTSRVYLPAIRNPSEFGFVNSSISCVGNPVVPRLTPIDECLPDPNTYFFYDDIHTNTVGYRLFAESAYSVLQQAYSTPSTPGSGPEPQSVPESSGALSLLGLGILGAASTSLQRGCKQVKQVRRGATT